MFGFRGSVRHRVFLLPGTEVGKGAMAGKGEEGEREEASGTGEHGAGRVLGGFRPSSRLAESGRNEGDTTREGATLRFASSGVC